MPRFGPELVRTRQIDKEAFFNTIEDLHIGEWHRKYAPERFGIVFLDGAWWELYKCFDIDQYGEG